MRMGCSASSVSSFMTTSLATMTVTVATGSMGAGLSGNIDSQAKGKHKSYSLHHRVLS